MRVEKREGERKYIKIRERGRGLSFWTVYVLRKTCIGEGGGGGSEGGNLSIARSAKTTGCS